MERALDVVFHVVAALLFIAIFGVTLLLANQIATEVARVYFLRYGGIGF